MRIRITEGHSFQALIVNRLNHNKIVTRHFITVLSWLVVPLCLVLWTIPAKGQQFFKVTLENIGRSFPYTISGIGRNINDRESFVVNPGQIAEMGMPIFPTARLSFVAKFWESNDLFFAPDEVGIPLFENGVPLVGDITDRIFLWDAGTELNEEPGIGDYQPPRQETTNTGPDDDNQLVRRVDDEFDYPAVSEMLRVTIELRKAYGVDAAFVHMANVSTEETLVLSDGSSKPVVVSESMYAVHTEPGPLFTPGQPASGALELFAEDGEASSLFLGLLFQTGPTPVLSPGVWVSYYMDGPLFYPGIEEPGMGLEALAEDGNTTPLLRSLSKIPQHTVGTFSGPMVPGSTLPANIEPGDVSEFIVAGKPETSLTIATKFVESNDLFVSTEPQGILLIPSVLPADGTFTDHLYLWNAGTEADEWPGLGPHQLPRQMSPNSGPPDSDNRVRKGGIVLSERFTQAFASLTIRPMQSVPFHLFIENIATDLPASTIVPIAFSPGVAVVHGGASPLFMQGAVEPGFGLEMLAEDGNPSAVESALSSSAGYLPHVFGIPEGETAPGLLHPGSKYRAVVEGVPGTSLSIALMFVESNDVFVAPGPSGIPLFDTEGNPITGDVTEHFSLWDAGTELNEEPGLGANQPARQSGPNTGQMDPDTAVRLVDDGFTYPEVSDILRVSVVPTQTATATLAELPNRVELYGNYPNPFTQSTTIAFSLVEATPVRLSIYNLLGVHIADLTDGWMSAGTHEILWDGRNAHGLPVSTGLYVYRLSASNTNVTKHMLRLR